MVTFMCKPDEIINFLSFYAIASIIFVGFVLLDL